MCTLLECFIYCITVFYVHKAICVRALYIYFAYENSSTVLAKFHLYVFCIITENAFMNKPLKIYTMYTFLCIMI